MFIVPPPHSKCGFNFCTAGRKSDTKKGPENDVKSVKLCKGCLKQPEGNKSEKARQQGMSKKVAARLQLKCNTNIGGK